MAYVTPLNTKKIKELSSKLTERFGVTFSKDYLWYVHTKKKDIYLLSKKAKEISLDSLRVNNLGLYVANLDNHDIIRLSIEGSQLLGPKATKSVIELDKNQLRTWLRGEDMPYEYENGYVIIKSGKDFCGCGRIKDNILLNFVPKGRRIRSRD
jgi:NOL1/NOP2/fmu family ribosome biogenesis protein